MSHFLNRVYFGALCSGNLSLDMEEKIFYYALKNNSEDLLIKFFDRDKFPDFVHNHLKTTKDLGLIRLFLTSRKRKRSEVIFFIDKFQSKKNFIHSIIDSNIYRDQKTLSFIINLVNDEKILRNIISFSTDNLLIAELALTKFHSISKGSLNNPLISLDYFNNIDASYKNREIFLNKIANNSELFFIWNYLELRLSKDELSLFINSYDEYLLGEVDYKLLGEVLLNIISSYGYDKELFERINSYLKKTKGKKGLGNISKSLQRLILPVINSNYLLAIDKLRAEFNKVTSKTLTSYAMRIENLALRYPDLAQADIEELIYKLVDSFELSGEDFDSLISLILSHKGPYELVEKFSNMFLYGYFIAAIGIYDENNYLKHSKNQLESLDGYIKGRIVTGGDIPSQFLKDGVVNEDIIGNFTIESLAFNRAFKDFDEEGVNKKIYSYLSKFVTTNESWDVLESISDGFEGTLDELLSIAEHI